MQSREQSNVLSEESAKAIHKIIEEMFTHPDEITRCDRRNDLIDLLATLDIDFGNTIARNCSKARLKEIDALLNPGDRLFEAENNATRILAKNIIGQYLMGNTSHLHIAARFGLVKTAKGLVEAKADVNKKDFNGISVLNLAAQNKQLDILRLLVTHHAEVTPMAATLAVTNSSMLALLLENKIDPNYTLNGRSLLNTAIASSARVDTLDQCRDSIKLLLEHKANSFNIVDEPVYRSDVPSLVTIRNLLNEDRAQRASTRIYSEILPIILNGLLINDLINIVAQYCFTLPDIEEKHTEGEHAEKEQLPKLFHAVNPKIMHDAQSILIKETKTSLDEFKQKSNKLWSLWYPQINASLITTMSDEASIEYFNEHILSIEAGNSAVKRSDHAQFQINTQEKAIKILTGMHFYLPEEKEIILLPTVVWLAKNKKGKTSRIIDERHYDFPSIKENYKTISVAEASTQSAREEFKNLLLTHKEIAEMYLNQHYQKIISTYKNQPQIISLLDSIFDAFPRLKHRYEFRFGTSQKGPTLR